MMITWAFACLSFCSSCLGTIACSGEPHIVSGVGCLCRTLFSLHRSDWKLCFSDFERVSGCLNILIIRRTLHLTVVRCFCWLILARIVAACCSSRSILGVSAVVGFARCFHVASPLLRVVLVVDPAEPWSTGFCVAPQSVVGCCVAPQVSCIGSVAVDSQFFCAFVIVTLQPGCSVTLSMHTWRIPQFSRASVLAGSVLAWTLSPACAPDSQHIALRRPCWGRCFRSPHSRSLYRFFFFSACVQSVST